MVAVSPWSIVLTKIIAIELDATLIRYNGFKGIEHFGLPYPGAVELTGRLSQLGEVWIYTCRTNPDIYTEHLPEHMDPRDGPKRVKDLIRGYLDSQGFHYHHIYVGPGKPFADLYIDDKGLDCRPSVFRHPTAQGRYYEMIAEQAGYRLA